MRILLVNQSWFAEEFRAAGHDVIVTGYFRDFEVTQYYPVLHIESIIKSLPRPFNPDLIIVYDESAPLLIAGLDETPIPTIFYSVDTHHHAPFQRYLAHVFDQTLIAQVDYRSQFEEVGISPEWFPLWASRMVEASDEKRHDVCFVGNVDRRLNPERVEFFEALQKATPVLVTQGMYWNYFPHSDIVINQTVKGDLNFRVFEAMMCGATLLTERQGNGLFQLFTEGQHLAAYEKGNVEDAVQQISALLANRARCREIARAGREEILKRHLPVHRAQRLLEIAKTVTKRKTLLRHFGAMVNFSNLANLTETKDTGTSNRALLHSLKAAEDALKAGEPCNNELACYLIRACIKYDANFKTMAGRDLLKVYVEAYPDVPFFALAYVRGLLNDGQQELAMEIATGRLGHIPPEKVFTVAEELVQTVLNPDGLR